MTNPTESSCPKCGAPIAADAPQGLCPKCVLAGAATLPEPTSSPAGKTPPPTLEDVAAHFPELEILELIGAGGMGAVYKARQPKLDRMVALKILSQDLAKDPAFAERFNREARVLARLDHPNIVTVFDFGTAGPFCFLMMEYADGVNLRQAMQAGGFTPAESLDLVQDICAALKFAHEKGILHRDIKPENVLLDSRGRVKIADFGIAKLIGQDETEQVTLTMEGAALGSPHYMAPEQFETPGDVDQRADIYSLGVVLYEMLTGELPLGRFAPPSEKAAMDARIDAIVLRTLAKEREARFQTAGEVRTEVEAVARSAHTGTKPQTERNPKTGRTAALIGAWLQLGLAIGFIASVASMMRAFNFPPLNGTGDPAALSGDISTALLPYLIGWVFGLIGAVLLLFALFAREYRAKWFYRFMMIYSIFLLTAFPVGTVVGIICLVHITKRKEEFLGGEKASGWVWAIAFVALIVAAAILIVATLPIFLRWAPLSHAPIRDETPRAVPQARPESPESTAEAHLRAILENDLETLEKTYADSVLLMPGHVAGVGPEATAIDRNRLLGAMEKRHEKRSRRPQEEIDAIMRTLDYESLKLKAGDFATMPHIPVGTPDGKLRFTIEDGDRLIQMTSTEDGEGHFLLFLLRRIGGDWVVVAEYMD